MYNYNYFQNKDFPISISHKTKELTPYTFMDNNTMWETKSIEYFFNNIIKNKEINVIDIGAQSGLYTLLAKYLPLSTFYAFEPYTPTYELLKENIMLNNITNIKCYNIGISNEKTTTILNTSISHNGLHTIGKNPLRFTDILPVSIEVDTIDNLFYDKDIPVHYMKIDTEGHEYFILKGAEKTIKKYKPLIQLEYNDVNMQQCNIKPNMLLDLIEELGYTKLHLIDEELFIVSKNM